LEKYKVIEKEKKVLETENIGKYKVIEKEKGVGS
jgi:hypothetical protein